jgi:MurNAc alpha-1-phosphate uridylyltransferase
MQAFILAAGLGKRMLPLTATTPKPLIQFGSQRLIEYSIKQLQQAGITDIIINTFHLADQIPVALGDGSNYGVKIRYSHESELLNTGFGIKNAINNKLLSAPEFIVVSSDIVCDFNLSKLPSKLTRIAHLVLVPNPDFNADGDFSLAKNQNNNLLLAPHIDNHRINYTFASIGIFKQEFFNNCPDQPFPLLSPIRQAIANQQITGELYLGAWQNIGSLEQLDLSQQV